MKIKDIFEVKYGSKSCESLEYLQPGKTPIITAGEFQHGVAYYANLPSEHRHCISIARVGSVGVSFYHKEATINSNCLVLKPKQKISETEMIFFATYITKQKWKWTYGRQVTPNRLKHIHLPAPPAWVNTIPIPDYSHLKNAKSEEEELKDWKNFDIHELFKISRQQGPSVEWVEENPGEIPFVSATKFNNGISGHCIETKEYQKVKGGCLTIQANGTDIGTCFLQKEDFYITGDVVTATPRVQISNEGLIYCATLISNNIYKFNYGRKFNGVRTHIKISLPTKNGLPNWDGIKQYMNSCKFSATI